MKTFLMKNSRRYIRCSHLAIAMLMFSAASVFAQGGLGKYGAPFLSISPYARQVAMGEAFTALANDVNVMRYNVGGLGNLQHTIFSLHFHKWIDDTQQGALEGALPLPSRLGVLGFNLTYFDEGEITDLNSDFQQTGGVTTSNDLVLSFGYGRPLPLLNNKLTFGAGVKFIRQDLGGVSASATGIDVGMLFVLKHVNFGATLQNFTVSKIQFLNQSSLLPETVRGGAALRLPFGPLNAEGDRKHKLNIGTDVAKVLDRADKKVRVYSGAELRLAEVIAVRGGYKFHDTELSRWGAGFGVIIPMEWLGGSKTELDYAYSPMNAFDSQAHRFSLSFNFGRVQTDRGQLAEMRERMAKELKAAEQARLNAQQTLDEAQKSRQVAEEARLAAEETERRLKALESEMAARLEKIKEIAKSSEGKIEVEPREKGNVLMTLRINFDFDKYVIRPSEYPTMFKVKQILDTYPEAKVWISGHTDNIGTDEYNMKLSEARMNSVMDFLTRHGIGSDRFFMPVPYGEWKPLTDNNTEASRFRNRRVEFYLYTGGNQPVVPEGSKIQTVQIVGDSTVSVVGNGRLNYTTSFVDNPPRLILKFPNVYIPDPKTIALNQGNFQQARMAYHPNERSTWVVFDLYGRLQQPPTWLSEDNRLMLRLRGNSAAERR
ncbi:MAG: PorV/PorQ family protein [candidate division KSB1 bacterium]|nr:PorV/PorQ family protein [candidate division KSB1 bacterium]MDZ7365930.1 PorV/PorQ family protein [candidate division KSB1 bacterium]MDZ7403836.1 PorV/PorQ family protein [candidate division KSB1 bacterium]